MRLRFVRPYKSIGYFSLLELPDFVVLTGVNGAGKSHLLEAIEAGAVQVNDLVQGPKTKPIRRFDWTNLVPQDTGAFAPYQITQERDELWRQLKQSRQISQEQIVNQMATLNPKLAALSPRQLLEITTEQLIEIGIPKDDAGRHLDMIRRFVSDEDPIRQTDSSRTMKINGASLNYFRRQSRTR